MKENQNLSLMAYNLLDAATALAGILDQRIERNCVRVNYQYASELIRDVQISAKSAASELMFIHDEKGGER
ncbi:MAG: hypothetical protein K2M79_07145 [Muribaculaceae bacterium]|nr:hypothetical protein [Muribaculaceae bacterium]